ncbi:MAG TPA: filamentous hemagglutinin, partial [Bradyrhizobium sp.]
DETITGLAPGDFAPIALKVDASRDNPLTVGPSGWTVPAGTTFYDVNYTPYGGGMRIAPGTKIFPGDTAKLPAGFTFTAGEFPNGIPLAATQITFAAGDIAPVQLRFAAGTTIPAGTVASRPFAVAALTELGTDIFKTGFSSYDINGHQGLLVVDRAVIDVAMPLYRFGTAALAAPTGSDPAAALELWLPPVNLEDPVNGRMARRAGADLMLESNLDLSKGMIAIGTDATITVDPGRRIALQSPGQITVDGRLTAAGGKIDVLQNGSPGNPFIGARSIWLADNAVLDVAGRSAVAVDRSGRRYGFADAGGSITLGADSEAPGAVAPAGNGFVIVRPGARLDASGASAVIDVVDAGAGSNAVHPVLLAGAGGSIAISTLSGFYLDGTMTARAGGEGAAGGTLSLALVTPSYSNPPDRPAPNEVRKFRILEVAGQAGASGLAPDLVWGARDPALQFGHGRIGADQVANGGFGNLRLYAETIAFDGDVQLTLPQSLRMFGNIVAKGGNERISLAAPYVSFGMVSFSPSEGAIEPRPGSMTGGRQPGFGTTPGAQPAKTGTAQLTVSADLVDLAGSFEPLNTAITQADNSTSVLTSIAGIDQVRVVSRGDIRVTGNTYGSRTLELDAAQIYPVSNANVFLAASDLVRFGRTTSDAPALPFSVFGKLTVYGTTIEQGGIVRAPLGTIILGGPALDSKNLVGVQQLDLLPGSITSVSAAGLAMPYGGTVDGIVYNYNGAAVTQALNGVDVWGSVVGGISLSGPAVTVASGALLDLSGGGQLLGAGFISGRGGSVDVLLNPLAAANPGNSFSSLKNQVFAIVPSANASYAPVVPASQGAAPSIGQRITVGGGVPGLAAGTYTLMPASYALLPGAFRVELGAPVQSASRTVALPNGSYVTTAYGSVANTSIYSSQPNLAVITPGATVRSYSQYNEQDYASFMLATAARTGQPRPSLPADAGVLQLILSAQPSAGPSFSFAGQALFTPGSGGYGGVVSVDTPYSRLEILGAASTPTAGFASVRAADLDAIGAARISLGGGQSLDLQNGYVGTYGFATTVVVRGGAVLRAPEVFITAGAGGIRIEDGARIDTVGAGAVTVMPSSDGFAYNVGGSGNMVIVSNGWVDMPPFPTGTVGGGITVGAATIATEGTLAFGVQKGALSIADSMRYGARYLSLIMPNVNIGDAAAIAAARAAGVLPDGLVLNQNVFGRLLAGNAVSGAPRLESLILSAQSSINFYGSLNLSTIDPATGRSSLRSLVLNTPAIYGLGAAGDSATLTTGQLVWNGINDGVLRVGGNGPRSVPPG